VKLPRLLLVNPAITSRRNARFPLSLLSLAAALQDRYDCCIVDGNVEADVAAAIRNYFSLGPPSAVGITVMGGPQVATAITASRLVRSLSPVTPIIWGGYFPTLNPEAALNAPYVDYLVRGQGEATLQTLLTAMLSAASADLGSIPGLSWRSDNGPVHNDRARLERSLAGVALPYHLLGDPRRYLAQTFLGNRTAAHQVALGCRFRCTFCGVATMFRGGMALPPPAALERDLGYLKHDLGADSIQYFDHNFFDREVDMVPLLEVQARMQLPWWCYARADALLDLSPRTWELVHKSQLRMAYIGAESPNDGLLHDIRKGTTSHQTVEVVRLCRTHGVVPELSFMVAPPVDPEGETERTFEFIRQIKRANPAAEIIVYVYTPVPYRGARSGALRERSGVELRDLAGQPVVFPETPEQWTEPEWVNYACHADAPWLSARLRQRIRDFVTVLRCRFPTGQDTRSPQLAKLALRGMAALRYQTKSYGNPWELDLAQRLVGLADPRATGI
jgi:radical SAM superfamily enzyme YgiQ (UPF0313 family)